MKFCISAAVFLLTVAAALASPLRLCHTNDFHAKYLEVGDANVKCQWWDSVADNCYSGIARLATALDQLSCDVKIQAGDWVQGSILDTIFKQQIAIDAYHWINYDFAVFGNHEFDYGNAHINETIRAIAPRTTWLSSNVYFDGQGMEDLPIHRFVDRHGICWVSILTAETMVLSLVEDNVSMEKEDRSLRKFIRKCEQQENVIAITHQGYENDLETCKNVKEIDLIIGAHTHTNLDNGQYPVKITREDGTICFVTQAYAHGRYVGVLDVEFDDEGTIHLFTTSYTALDYRIKRDPDVLSKVMLYNAQVSKKAELPVGTVTDDIMGGLWCRGPEEIPADGTTVDGDCSMGNLICDSVVATAPAATDKNPRISFVNGGTLRNSFTEGKVTLRDLINVLPYGNEIASMTLKGKDVLKALVYGFSLMATDNRGGYIAGVSSNMRVHTAVDGSKSGEAMVVIEKVTVDGKDLDPEADYTLLVNEYMAQGGDGFSFPGEYTALGTLIRDATQDYLEKHDPYSPVASRIQLSGTNVDALNKKNAELDEKTAEDASAFVHDESLKVETELDASLVQPAKKVKKSRRKRCHA